jgi:hypothetical protein
MHRAYFSESCCICVWLGGGPEPAAPVAAFVLPAPTLATEGNFEPPQPETSRPALVSVATAR